MDFNNPNYSSIPGYELRGAFLCLGLLGGRVKVKNQNDRSRPHCRKPNGWQGFAPNQQGMNPV